MNPSLSETATLVPLSLIVVAGLVHIRHFDGLREDLTSHDVVPARWVLAAGFALVGLELGLGIAGMMSWSIGTTHALRMILVGLGLLYLLFTAYSLFLLVRRPGVRCGCSRSAVPNNAVVVGRALLLAAFCSLAAWRPSDLAELNSLEMTLFALAPAASIGAILHVLPATVEHPASLALGFGERVSAS